MSAFQNNPWVQKDKNQAAAASKLDGNPWVQKDKAKATGGEEEQGKNLKNPRKIPEKEQEKKEPAEEVSGWKEPPAKKIGKNPFENA